MKRLSITLAIAAAWWLFPQSSKAWQAESVVDKGRQAESAADDESPSQDADERSLARRERNEQRKKNAEDMAHFLRIRRDGDRQPLAMETSVTRYVGQNDKGERIVVDLIGVVHVGEKDYYQQLNELFEQYDGMLYELVAPEGTIIPKGGRQESGITNPVAALQLGMKSALGLEFQLDHVDYTKDNFVHADMSPDEFSASMKENDESLTKMFFKAIGQSMAQQSAGRISDADMLMAMFSGKWKRRQIIADQMQSMESGMVIFEGREGSTIIDHRNAKAMDILKREISSGKQKLALFYGAGHLPDMQRRLESEFHMKRGGQFWLTAWQLENPDPSTADE